MLMQQVNLPEVLTVEEAAVLLRLSAYTVRELARKGKLPARKIGGEWRFSRKALLELVEGRDSRNVPAGKGVVQER